MTRRLILLAFAAALLTGSPAGAQIGRFFGFEDESLENWTGDLDGMVERRRVRMLVVPSRTFYFVDKGTQRGQETVRYVANIYKYYVAYRLVVEAQEERDEALESVGAP